MQQLRKAHRQFYFVVYTQTDADVGRYVCGGGLDLGLNEAGLEEARKMARRFKKNPLKIKRIIASPELRAIQMADVLHDEIKVKMAIKPEFADQFMGDLEGKPLKKDLDFEHPPRGEAGMVFSGRIHSGLVRILQEEGLVLLVTHERVIQAIFHGIGLEHEKFARGTMYVVDIPEGDGVAHLREVGIAA